MKMNRMRSVVATTACVLGMASIAAAANVGVGVDVNTPNVRVQVGAPPPPPVAIVQPERVIIRESGDRHDYGKHKGHYKKHKHKKHH